MNDFYELESDFTDEELNQLVKEIKKKKENEKKVKEIKRKKRYQKRGYYNESKKLEFFKDCIVIKIGTRERRKNAHE